MAPNSAILKAVEALDYRVTIGDVASQAGLDIKIAERDLLALASEAGGHLQVAESGEIAYRFPKNFRTILRNKYWQLRFKEAWSKVWGILFYLIRISFGILLIASIILISIAIIAIMIALSASDSDSGGGSGSRGHSGGGGGYMPWLWFGPDWYWFFTPNSRRRRSYTTRRAPGQSAETNLNFLEGIYSFLFGDGNPNANLEERRWQTIATVIRNNGGVAVAEQITPYLDTVKQGTFQDQDDAMLPVLSRFNGRPEVSPTGQIIYHFPELQVTAAQRKPQPVAAYLRELPWRFSQASSGQVIGAIGLGGVNLIGALVLARLLGDGAIAAELGGLVAFVSGIYWILLAYGIAFLAIPLVRYFWIQWRNRAIEARNQQRQERAVVLSQAGDEVKQKIAFARQFVATTVIDEANLAYTTERDLTEQELQQADAIDEEWQRRLREADS
jgi:flagellar basal body-associated protein FliL